MSITRRNSALPGLGRLSGRLSVRLLSLAKLRERRCHRQYLDQRQNQNRVEEAVKAHEIIVVELQEQRARWNIATDDIAQVMDVGYVQATLLSKRWIDYDLEKASYYLEESRDELTDERIKCNGLRRVWMQSLDRHQRYQVLCDQMQLRLRQLVEQQEDAEVSDIYPHRGVRNV